MSPDGQATENMLMRDVICAIGSATSFFDKQNFETGVRHVGVSVQRTRTGGVYPS